MLDPGVFDLIFLSDIPTIHAVKAKVDEPAVLNFLHLPHQRLDMEVRAEENSELNVELRYRYELGSMQRSNWSDWRVAGNFRQSPKFCWGPGKRKLMERHPRRVLSEYKLFLKRALSLKFRRVSPLVVVVDIGCSAKGARQAVATRLWLKARHEIYSARLDTWRSERPPVQLPKCSVLDNWRTGRQNFPC